MQASIRPSGRSAPSPAVCRAAEVRRASRGRQSAPCDIAANAFSAKLAGGYEHVARGSVVCGELGADWRSSHKRRVHADLRQGQLGLQRRLRGWLGRRILGRRLGQTPVHSCSRATSDSERRVGGLRGRGDHPRRHALSCTRRLRAGTKRAGAGIWHTQGFAGSVAAAAHLQLPQRRPLRRSSRRHSSRRHSSRPFYLPSLPSSQEDLCRRSRAWPRVSAPAALSCSSSSMRRPLRCRHACPPCSQLATVAAVAGHPRQEL